MSEHHYLTRVWHMNTANESKRLKDIMSRHGLSVTLNEARDIIIKFFESPITQEFIKNGVFPVSIQPYTGNIMQDTTTDLKYVIALTRNFNCVDIGNGNKEYQFTLVVANKEYYETLDNCKLKLNYGLFNQEKKEIMNAFIGVEGIN